MTESLLDDWRSVHSALLRVEQDLGAAVEAFAVGDLRSEDLRAICISAAGIRALADEVITRIAQARSRPSRAPWP